jgi:hypothetical protein
MELLLFHPPTLKENSLFRSEKDRRKQKAWGLSMGLGGKAKLKG